MQLGLLAGLAGCTPHLSTAPLPQGAGSLSRIELSVSNVYVVEGSGGAVLVDAGDPDQEGDVLNALARLEIHPASVRLLVVTHAHADHIGSAAALQARLSVPVALARADVATARAGHNPTMHPTGPTAELLLLVLRQDFAPVAPELLVDGCLDLADYGVEGRLVAAPGHTPGSSVVLLAGGDAIVGDLALGGYLGGTIAPQVPTEHYFQEHPRAVRAILEWLLASGAERFHLGHGGPVSAEDLRTALAGGDLGPPPDQPFVPDCPALTRTSPPR
ncbi:MAG: MBL fold metallo-hydrolase [Sandaracinaceae bacterium]